MNIKKYWMVLAIALVGICMVSCSKDDGGTRNDPVTTSDPEGTIVANLANEKSVLISGLGSLSIRMNSANNLYVSYGDIVSVGSVQGLSSITKVPESGWTSTTAAIPGYGYVLRYAHYYYDDAHNWVYDSQYARLYVVDYMESTSGSIMGCTIKYQVWDPNQ